MNITNLTDTERGFMSCTQFKTLVSLSSDFIRNNSYDVVEYFGARFRDFSVGNDNDEIRTIRAVKCNLITREDMRWLKLNNLI